MLLIWYYWLCNKIDLHIQRIRLKLTWLLISKWTTATGLKINLISNFFIKLPSGHQTFSTNFFTYSNHIKLILMSWFITSILFFTNFHFNEAKFIKSSRLFLMGSSLMLFLDVFKMMIFYTNSCFLPKPIKDKLKTKVLEGKFV